MPTAVSERMMRTPVLAVRRANANVGLRRTSTTRRLCKDNREHCAHTGEHRPRIYALFVKLNAADTLPAVGIEVRDRLAHLVTQSRRPAHANNDTGEVAMSTRALLTTREQGRSAFNDALQVLAQLRARRRQRETRGKMRKRLEHFRVRRGARVIDRDAERRVRLLRLRDKRREQREQGCQCRRILNAPHELHRADTGAVLQVLLHQVLDRSESERDPAPTRDEHGAGKARKDGVSRAAVRALDDDLDAAAHAVRLAVVGALRKVVELVRPVASLLDHEHEALATRAPTNARDRERVRLSPPAPAHAKREHAQTDVLARAPAGVQPRDLDTGHAEIREGPQTRHNHARLDEPHEAIEAIRAGRDCDVRHADGVVEAERDTHDHGEDDVRRDEDRVVEPLAHEVRREQQHQVCAD